MVDYKDLENLRTEIKELDQKITSLRWEIDEKKKTLEDFHKKVCGSYPKGSYLHQSFMHNNKEVIGYVDLKQSLLEMETNLYILHQRIERINGGEYQKQIQEIDQTQINKEIEKVGDLKTFKSLMKQYRNEWKQLKDIGYNYNLIVSAFDQSAYSTVYEIKGVNALYEKIKKFITKFYYDENVVAIYIEPDHSGRKVHDLQRLIWKTSNQKALSNESFYHL